MEIDEELVLWFINNVSDEMKEIFPFHQLKKIKMITSAGMNVTLMGAL